MSLLGDAKAIERAALVLWMHEMAYSENANHRRAVRRRWDSTTESVRESYRHAARTVIAAAEGVPVPPRDLMTALRNSLDDARPTATATPGPQTGTPAHHNDSSGGVG